MACERFAQSIRDSAFGAPIGDAAAAHLVVCRTCQAMFRRERQLAGTIESALADVGAVPPGTQFVSRVRGRVEASRDDHRARRWLAPSFALVAVVAIAVVLGRLPRDRTEFARAAEATVAVPAQPLQHERAPVLDAHTPRTLVTRAKSARRVAAASTEVLVPREQREAIVRLFNSLRAGRPEVVSMLMSLHEADSAPGPVGVTVTPLKIDPVVITAIPPSPSIFDR